MEDLNSHNHSFRISELVLKHLRNETSQQEEEELEQWLAESEKNRLFLKSLESETAHKPDLDFFNAIDQEAAWQKIARKTGQDSGKRTSFLNTPVWRYAAVVLVLLSLGLLPYLLLKKIETPAVAHVAEPKGAAQEILPGTDKARLELADGTLIFLDQTQDGQLKSENGALISKERGVIRYTAQQIGQATGSTYNKISTPKGGQFQIVLADGTKVWLNAESSLRFPTAFSGSERLVEMTGEAYFEVARDKNKVFKVSTKGVAVQVLGTHFNVMAYDNEHAVKTTLVEGSVRVVNGLSSETLIPNQQAIVSGHGLKVIEVDPEEFVAWKNGYFHFYNTSLDNVMRQLERWYDIEVDYRKTPNKHFTGVVSRQTDIKKVLGMLEATGGIRFKIEGKKITSSQ